MAPFHGVTFEGYGALCARLATKRLLLHDRSCCKLSFGTTFDGFDLKFALGDSEIYDLDFIKNSLHLAFIRSRRAALLLRELRVMGRLDVSRCRGCAHFLPVS